MGMNHLNHKKAVARKLGFGDDVREAIIWAYRKTQSSTTTGKMFGMTGQAIYKRLRAWGVEVLPRGGDHHSKKFRERAAGLLTKAGAGPLPEGKWSAPPPSWGPDAEKRYIDTMGSWGKTQADPGELLKNYIRAAKQRRWSASWSTEDIKGVIAHAKRRLKTLKQEGNI